MNLVRVSQIAIIAFFCLVAFSFASAEEITIYGSDEGTQVIQVPDSPETQQWHRVYGPGEQEAERRQVLERERQEQQKRAEEAQAARESRQLRLEQERIKAEQERVEMEQNKRGDVAQRPLNPMEFNYGQPLQQQTGRDAVRPSWDRGNPARGDHGGSPDEGFRPGRDQRNAVSPSGHLLHSVAGGWVDTETGEFIPR